MGNVISALSLILGMFIAVYLKWIDEINNAFKVEIPKHKEDGRNQYLQVRKINWLYLFPLTLTSFILTAIIIPEWFKVIVKTISVIEKEGFDIINYDIVLSIFLLIGAISIAFTVYLTICFSKLLIKTKILNPNVKKRDVKASDSIKN